MSQQKHFGRLPLNPRVRGTIPGILIFLLVCLAYFPALHGGFIWDDDAYVTENPLLTAPDGLKRIWFTTDSTSQYFPLTYTAFRIERALWGLNPAGYHWVNLLLHAANAVLVWRLLRRMSVPGAWLAAAVFALHPVQVESIAWITELKNVLMYFFYLLTLRTWYEFVEGREWRFYWLALVCYGMALCSKTTACTLPAVLLLILWLKRRPIDWKHLAQVFPFMMMAIGMGLLTMWWERFHQGTHGKLFSLGLAERVLVASHALWFYLGKIFWPVNLTFSYPHWTIHPTDPFAYGWLAAGILFVLAVYFTRRFTGRSVETAALFFVVSLGPVLGFIMLYTFRYTYVADHYQYIACLGPIALAATGITMTFEHQRITNPLLKFMCCGGLLLSLGVLTWRQAGVYQDQETLWRDTLVKNPDCWMAHNNLGVWLKNQGRIEEAMEQYHMAIQGSPDFFEALDNLGVALVAEGRLDEAIDSYHQALQISPLYFTALNNLGVALAAKGRFDEAIHNYRQVIQINPNFADGYYNLGVALAAKGQSDQAIKYYRQALQLNPSHSQAHYNLGIALVAKGRLDEAIENYRQAIQIKPDFSEALDNLGIALADMGRLDEAITNFSKTIHINPDHFKAHYNLGLVLAAQGRFEEAIDNFRQAVRLNPDFPQAMNRLAWLLAVSPDEKLRNGNESVGWAERACELTHHGNPLFVETLSAAYAEEGRFPEAVTAAEMVEQLANAAGLKNLSEKNRQLLELYRVGKPYHGPAPTEQ